MGAGQFCTDPGITVVVEGPDTDRFAAAIRAAPGQVDPQVILTESIAEAYRCGNPVLDSRNAVRLLVTSDAAGREAGPNLYETRVSELLADPALGQEVFGPLGLIVLVCDLDEMLTLARGLEGRLTATLHMDGADLPHAQRLLPILECKAGRVLVNGFPTGVEVCDVMVNGGPYPTSTNFGATSAGTMAIRRFLRPVCYQNLPGEFVSEDLRQMKTGLWLRFFTGNYS